MGGGEMGKRTTESRNRRSITALQKSSIEAKKALRKAEKRIDWLVDTLLNGYSELLQRIQFLEHGEVARHESNIRCLKECRDKKWTAETEELR
jgi:hypothetical protein